MTNKETATMLKSIRELFSVSYSPESIAALSKAIELIEQMPDEHGDLIDRSLLCADLAGVILSHRGLGIAEVIARQPAIIAAERRDNGR
jgi:hypothetical protein